MATWYIYSGLWAVLITPAFSFLSSLCAALPARTRLPLCCFHWFCIPLLNLTIAKSYSVSSKPITSLPRLLRNLRLKISLQSLRRRLQCNPQPVLTRHQSRTRIDRRFSAGGCCHVRFCDSARCICLSGCYSSRSLSKSEDLRDINCHPLQMVMRLSQWPIYHPLPDLGSDRVDRTPPSRWQDLAFQDGTHVLLNVFHGK